MRRRIMSPMIAAGVALGVLTAAVAGADEVFLDGDNLEAAVNVNITDCSVLPKTYNGTATVRYQGNQHFASGATVTVSTSPSSGAAAAGITTGGGGTLVLPSPWTTGGEATKAISVTVPAGIANGTYKIDGSVSGPKDGNGTHSDTDFYNVNVNCATTTTTTQAPADAAPVVDAGGPYSGNEGGAITLNDGSFTDAGDTSTHTALWSIQSQSVSPGTCSLANATSLSTASITCTDNGSAVVKLTVTDGGTPPLSGSDTANVTVANLAPNVSTPVLTPTSACAVSLSAGFSDPGAADTHSASVDWGDATSSSVGVATNPVTGTHTYTSPGTKTVTLAVTDDDGDTGTSAGASFTTKNTPSGIQQPINLAGQRSVFKIGSTLPVKITVTNCAGASVGTLTPTVQLDKVDNVPDGPVNEPQISEVPTNGKLMRWDATGLLYIYNLSTKNSQFSPSGGALTSGTYRLTVSDGSFFAPSTAYFDLRT